MVVKITPKFRAGDIEKMMLQQIKIIEQAIIQRWAYIGERFVVNARNNGNYTDRTGNLRNSIGYVILKNGQQLMENFTRSAKVKTTITRGKNKGQEKVGKGSTDGIKEGKDLIEEIRKKYPRGIVLIVVAGMHYAAAVESKGKDVLTASSQIAGEDLKKAIASFKAKIK